MVSKSKLYELSYYCVKCVQRRSFFCSVFSCIPTEYREIQSISPYSVRMRENTDQKKLRIWTRFTQCMSYAQFIKMYYENQRLNNSYLIEILFKNANTDSHFRPFLLLMQQSLPQMDDRKSVEWIL